MLNCICVDIDKISRADIERKIRKKSELQLIKTCASLDAAFNICKSHKIDILFVRLYLFPVPKKRISWLRKIANTGTQIIILSSRITIARDILDLNITNFVYLPTTPARLWKASMKALGIIDYGINIAKMKRQEPDKIISPAN